MHHAVHALAPFKVYRDQPAVNDQRGATNN